MWWKSLFGYIPYGLLTSCLHCKKGDKNVHTMTGRLSLMRNALLDRSSERTLKVIHRARK